ncbi:9754_t:CDS:2, partial [Diversispora eburnea]
QQQPEQQPQQLVQQQPEQQPQQLVQQQPEQQPQQQPEQRPQQQPLQPQKRGRGRPRKYVLPTQQQQPAQPTQQQQPVLSTQQQQPTQPTQQQPQGRKRNHNDDDYEAQAGSSKKNEDFKKLAKNLLGDQLSPSLEYIKELRKLKD